MVFRGSFRNPWKFISQGLQTFLKNISLRVGAGNRIRFWRDVWCGDTTFESSFPRLFRLSVFPNVFIADIFSTDANNDLGWDFGFRRGLNNREAEEMQSLLLRIHSFSQNGPRPYRRVWVCDSSVFTCKSFFLSLLDNHEIPKFEPFSFIWKSMAGISW